MWCVCASACTHPLPLLHLSPFVHQAREAAGAGLRAGLPWAGRQCRRSHEPQAALCSSPGEEGRGGEGTQRLGRQGCALEGGKGGVHGAPHEGEEAGGAGSSRVGLLARRHTGACELCAVCLLGFAAAWPAQQTRLCPPEPEGPRGSLYWLRSKSGRGVQDFFDALLTQ